MNLLALLNLALALSNLNEAKSTPFFSEFHLQQTSSVEGIVTFQPALEPYRGHVKLVVVVNEDGCVANTKLEIQRGFIDGAQSSLARELVKAYLNLVLASEDQVEANALILEISTAKLSPIRSPGYRTFLGKQAHFESRFSGALLTMDNPTDQNAGWLVIFAGRNDGPRLGHFITSYNLKGKGKPAN